MQEIDFSPHNSYCLTEFEAIVGFGQMIPKSEQRIHLARIIVPPARRGQGYGRHLCRALLIYAAELNYPRISLNVYRDNSAALKLYHSFGFRLIDKIQAGGQAEDICYMEAEPYQPQCF